MSDFTEKLKSTLGRFGEGESKKGNIADILKSTFGKAGEGAAKKAKALKDQFSQAASGLAKEAKVTPALHEHSVGVVRKLRAESKQMKGMIDDAYAYAIFPNIARAGLVLGISYGKGEVFEQGNVIGYAGVAQITAGVQLGGETYHLLVIMDDPEALKRFKMGKTNFATNASIAFVKGAMAGRSPAGLRFYLRSEGGEMIELALGGQKIKFVPAGLGRLRHADLSERKGEFQGDGSQRAKSAKSAKSTKRKTSAKARAPSSSTKTARARTHSSHAATRH